jgi:murein DD-endopeptidase MepM/ murein hydrolase activator NlpD
VRRARGLLIGLLLALATIVLAAVSVTAGPAADQSRIAASPTPTTVTAQVAATATAAPLAVAAATEPATPRPTEPATPTPALATQPAPTTTPEEPPAASIELVIGYSVEGRPITAYRVGSGAIKVALIGDIHGAYEANTHLLAQQLLDYFQAHPDEVPANVSLWIVPTMNPDGLETGHRWNANEVDLNRNADTDLDGCGRNDWSPDAYGPEGQQPGSGGSFPFSEPEARAIHGFLGDASIAVFYHSAAEAIFIDTCQRHIPTARLADALSLGSGYPVPEEGWAGYPVTGDFGDYLAGEGVAAVTVELTGREDPEFERNLGGVRSLLDAVDEIVSAEATAVGAEYVSIDAGTTGMAQFAANTFIHPSAMTVIGPVAYLLDGGRILSVSLNSTDAAEIILDGGEYVEDVRVLEVIDLTDDGTSLLALDRAGDVYRYNPSAESWTLDRYDRPVRDTYDHYFVALDAGSGANYLLETTHEQVWRFTGGQRGASWIKLPQRRDVDLSAGDAGLYVLTRDMNSPVASFLRYDEGRLLDRFAPNVDILHPRQVVAAGETVYVLDRAGRRLLAFEPESGALLTLYQFADRTAVSAVWADPDDGRVILAGRDALYFLGQPAIQHVIEAGPTLQGPQPHDTALLQTLRGLSSPIEGATMTSRDFQMPGAPRHYRLGVHEGIDFYSNTVGATVNRGTPVHAVADGVVIRALTDYQPLTAAQSDAWVVESIRLGYTPPEVLDGYRGRQVWIDHGGGLVSRYAHLGSIEPGIVEGAEVTRGQVIARVGNSGTPGSVNSQTYDVHLHLELWVGDHFVGQFLRPIEAREWLERILR